MVFWGIEVTQKGVTFTPPFNLHITQAALGANLKASEERNVLTIKNEDGAFPLCSLKLGGSEHTGLDVILSEGMEYYFSASGKNSIFITGYFVDSMLGDESDEDSEDAEMEEEEERALMNGVGGDSEDDSEDDDEEFFDEELSKEDEEALAQILQSKATKNANKKEVKQPVKPTPTKTEEKPKQQDNKRKAETQITKEQPKNLKPESPAKPVTKKEAASPKSVDNGTLGKLITTKTGLQYQDLKIGTGPNVVSGKNVTVHYTGKLVSNGKIFDSSLRSGKPFTFRLGMQQVIQGWDQGVAGMKVGGKRTLVIPPQLGYGKQGAGKDIPPNAALHFEVEVVKA